MKLMILAERYHGISTRQINKWKWLGAEQLIAQCVQSQLRHVAKCVVRIRPSVGFGLRLGLVRYGVLTLSRTLSISVTVTPIARNRLCPHWVQSGSVPSHCLKKYCLNK